jgi:hypothetical protein
MKFIAKTTADEPVPLDAVSLRPVPTPPINLHDVEAVRREMARVYRGMKAKTIDTQDGTRLVYVLTQIAKLHELVEIERRMVDLERIANEPKRKT